MKFSYIFFVILTTTVFAQWEIDDSFPSLPQDTWNQKFFFIPPDTLIFVRHHIPPPPPYDEDVIIYVKDIHADTSWTMLYNDTPLGDQICYVNSRLAFAATFYLMKSTDGGISWQLIYDFKNSYPYSGVNGVYFKDEQNGYVTGGTGGRGFWGETEDGGLSWDFHTIPFPGFCRNIVVINDSTFLVSEQYNGHENICKSTNYGSTWNLKNTNTFSVILKLYFTNENDGWALGEPGKILKTNDAGENWVDVSPSFSSHYMDCKFFSQNIGWVVGGMNGIWTSDGGNTWENSLNTYDILSTVFINPDTGFIMTEYQVFKTTNGGGFPTKIKSSGNDLTEFKLQQNYPNPFNPITTINYNIASPAKVILRVFDVLGNEVAMLVNEEKPAGSYSVKFDGSSLSSGIYYYQMKAGDFTATKKLILLK